MGIVMVRLFISYRSLDSAKVDAIVQNLSTIRASDGSKRYSTWQDKRDMPVGHNWWESIVDAIEACDVFVFHISQESLKSEVCQAELAYALQRNRFIIPVVLEGEFSFNLATGKYDIDYWSLVPARLKNTQFLFYTGTAFFDQFQKTIDRYEQKPPHDTPAQRPLHPSEKGGRQYSSDVYNEACEYALRLAFDEARSGFQQLSNSKDADFDEIAQQWLTILYEYENLVKWDAKPSTRFKIKDKWPTYAALFPKTFIDGIFDPKGIAVRLEPLSVVSIAPKLPQTLPSTKKHSPNGTSAPAPRHFKLSLTLLKQKRVG
jgi:hypothetical protein